MGPLMTPLELPADVRRLEGWEMRLDAVLSRARRLPYVIGQHDCFRVACGAVEALTGINLWASWAGSYRTRLEALRRIHAYAGAGFGEAFSKLFAVAPADTKLARRGDIVQYVERSEPHLGVCVGSEIALLAADGLRFYPRRLGRHCWRIG